MKKGKNLKVAIKFYFRSSDRASVARTRSYWSLAGWGGVGDVTSAGVRDLNCFMNFIMFVEILVGQVLQSAHNTT